MAIGLGLFALIGAVLAYALSESNVRQALVLGVAAPGIITNLVSGAQDLKIGQQDIGQFLASTFISSVYAQASPEVSPILRAEKEAANQPRRVVVSTSLQNADAWSGANLRIGVKFLTIDGEAIGPTANFFANDAAALSVPEGAARAAFMVGGKVVPVDLQQLGTTSVRLRADVTGKNDLAWALGARRQPTLTDLQVNAVK